MVLLATYLAQSRITRYLSVTTSNVDNTPEVYTQVEAALAVVYVYLSHRFFRYAKGIQ